MDQTRADLKAAGEAFQGTHLSGIIAEAYGEAGEAQSGLTAVNEGLAMAETTGVVYYLAELNRVRGELLLLHHGDSAAEDAGICFRAAFRIAQQQEAKSWELRAAISLGRLAQRQGTGAEARELLGGVYGWFTEGFDTADLKEAKALLEELGQ